MPRRFLFVLALDAPELAKVGLKAAQKEPDEEIMDQETREFLDSKFNAVDEKFEETKRHFGVVAEGLRSEMRQIAEGVANVDEKLERFRREVQEEFKDVKAMIKFSHTELDRRITTLESEVTSVKARVELLEARQR